MTTPLTTTNKNTFLKVRALFITSKLFSSVVYCSSLVFKDSVYSTQILLRIGFAAVLIITAALWSAQENAEF
jgi:hypothetical protein